MAPRPRFSEHDDASSEHFNPDHDVDFHNTRARHRDLVLRLKGAPAGSGRDRPWRSSSLSSADDGDSESGRAAAGIAALRATSAPEVDDSNDNNVNTIHHSNEERRFLRPSELASQQPSRPLSTVDQIRASLPVRPMQQDSHASPTGSLSSSQRAREARAARLGLSSTSLNSSANSSKSEESLATIRRARREMSDDDASSTFSERRIRLAREEREARRMELEAEKERKRKQEEAERKLREEEKKRADAQKLNEARMREARLLAEMKKKKKEDEDENAAAMMPTTPPRYRDGRIQTSPSTDDQPADDKERRRLSRAQEAAESRRRREREEEEENMRLWEARRQKDRENAREMEKRAAREAHVVDKSVKFDRTSSDRSKLRRNVSFETLDTNVTNMTADTVNSSFDVSFWLPSCGGGESVSFTVMEGGCAGAFGGCADGWLDDLFGCEDDNNSGGGGGGMGDAASDKGGNATDAGKRSSSIPVTE